MIEFPKIAGFSGPAEPSASASSGGAGLVSGQRGELKASNPGAHQIPPTFLKMNLPTFLKITPIFDIFSKIC